MNFNSLSSNEKLGLYGAVAVIVGMLIASAGLFGFGLGTLALLAAIAMLVVIFLPQMSEGSSLPGSKGTLMLACGIIAAAVLVITLIQILPFIGSYLGTVNGIFFLIALVGSLAMAWAGWQELQGEGGSMRFGGTGTATPGGPPRSDASAPPAAPRPTSSAPPPASSWSDTSQPAAGSGGGSAAGGSEGAPSSGSGYGGGSASGMGSTGSAPSSGGADMGSEGGATSRRDDEGPPRNP